jgi:NADH:ubiquinone oxidoreductase subunit 4 (subunit M)
MLGFGLDVLEALPRRGRFSAVLAVVLLLSFGLWPELLLEIARLRVEPILEAVTESVQDVGSRAQGR